MDKTTIDISWQAPEYSHKERSIDWFWAVGVIALAGAGLAIWTGSYIFAVFIVVAGFAFIVINARTPEEMHCHIGESGIEIGRDKFPWKSIGGFQVIDGSPYAKLIIETSKKFMPVYTIPLPIGISEEVTEALLQIIPLADHLQESRSMILLEKIGL